MEDVEEFVLVYCPFPQREEAVHLARHMVKERLIACANIVDNVISLYEWEGSVEQSSEVIMLMKTKREAVSLVEEAIVQAHPYEVPAIVTLSLEECNQPYLDWLTSKTNIKGMS